METTEEVPAVAPVTEVKISPVASVKAKEKKNKDGFIQGQEVSEKDYFAHVSKLRNTK